MATAAVINFFLWAQGLLSGRGVLWQALFSRPTAEFASDWDPQFEGRA